MDLICNHRTELDILDSMYVTNLFWQDDEKDGRQSFCQIYLSERDIVAHVCVEAKVSGVFPQVVPKHATF